MFRVAIIGRPNVGKSALFNRLTRTRKAIVGDEPGITRDRLDGVVRWNGKQFELIDTGGIIPHQKQLITRKVLEQAEIAMAEADLILFVVDVRDGITPLDRAVNSMLRSKNKKCFLVVNKVDVPRLEEDTLEFYALGVDALYPVSAEHKEGAYELLEGITQEIPPEGEAEPEKEIRIAIIGRPNVGKSSLLNRWLGRERTIVTDIPGTTRDAVDTLLRFKGHACRLIDTAGIRRKGKTELKAEKLAVVMARRNLEQADVVMLVMDAGQGPHKLDATIGGYAHKAGKSIILVVNKWDLVAEGARRSALENEFRTQLRFLDYAPLLLISAKTGLRVFQLLDRAREAYEARLARIPTAELNEFMQTQVQPFLSSGEARKPPVKYAAQVGVSPPTFVLFTRGAGKLHFSTVRYLVNQLRKRFGFYATPVRILQRRRAKRS